MAAQSSGKIEELESIRGAAALLVVFFHMPAWNSNLHETRLFLNSYYMVDLFFVLSGFVMNLNYGARVRTVPDVIRFQFLRWARLYPVHVLFLMLAVLTTASSWVAATMFDVKIPNGGAFRVWSMPDFAAQLLLVHSLGFFKVAHPLNLPSWSISVEFYTYLIFAVLCLITHHASRLWAYSLLASLALALLSFGGDSIGNFSEILQCLAGYFLGCLVASFAARHPRSLPRGSTIAALAAMTLFLCLKVNPRFDVTIFFLSAALIVAVVCSGHDGAKRILGHRSLKFLGLISYSIYMSHMFVLWVCNQFVRIVLRRPEAVIGGISTPQMSLPGALLWHAIAVAATIFLSTLVFKFVEDPFRLWSKDFARRFLNSKRRDSQVVLENRDSGGEA